MRFAISETQMGGQSLASVVGIDGDNIWHIPMSEDNAMYQQYLAWLAEGNEPEEWNPNATE